MCLLLNHHFFMYFGRLVLSLNKCEYKTIWYNHIHELIFYIGKVTITPVQIRSVDLLTTKRNLLKRNKHNKQIKRTTVMNNERQ